jgi:four helix bundle protein
VRSFRELIVWQKSMALVTAVYHATDGFPSNEMLGLVSQMRRCAVSIPSNTAEGYGRYARKELSRHLHTSVGSLYELQTQLEISRNLGFIDDGTYEQRNESTREVERLAHSFLKRMAT